ncbi:DUF3310 domain-containing protein [Paenibacillus sp. Pae108]|uniref:DUF3310 domain-containing protein n=1 Tax=Paenibacillus sp. Pae108 TaxID=2926019 RepID=UPI0035C75F0E
MTTQHDPVNNPSHYTSGGIETIDYLKAKMTPEQFEGFLLGNCLKYLSRYRNKNGLEDLKKANWYLNKLIEKNTPSKTQTLKEIVDRLKTQYP